MTVAIDFSTHRARLLKAGPGGLGPSLDNQQTGRACAIERGTAWFLLRGRRPVRWLLLASQATPLDGSGPAGSSRQQGPRYSYRPHRTSWRTGHQERTHVARVARDHRDRRQSLGPHCGLASSPARWSVRQSLPGHDSRAGLSVCRANLDCRGAAVRAFVAAAGGRCRAQDHADATDRKR